MMGNGGVPEQIVGRLDSGRGQIPLVQGIKERGRLLSA